MSALYFTLGVPVATLAGDIVCADSDIVVINDRVMANTLLIDCQGRPLPAWHGCRPLARGEVFLLMSDVPARLSGSGFRHRGQEESLDRTHPIVVMAGLVPAIHAFSGGNKHVDARDKPAHDDDHVRVECTLTTGFVEPDSRDVPASFDSRYFGPVASDAIVGRLVPLWTW